MPDRVNHLAAWVAALVYFFFGYLWYGVIFASAWTAYMASYAGNSAANMQGSPTQYAITFVLGLILSYATAIALTRRPEDQTAQQGISFALFMGVAIYGTQTLNNALYSGQPLGLWLINAGYVIVGFAIIGAINGGWKKRAAA